MIVTLSKKEVREALDLAKARHLMNACNGARSTSGGENTVDLHETGALGERAVHKHTGIPWRNKLGNYGATDIGGLYEVRATHHGDGCLLLRPHEPVKEYAPYILALIGARVGSNLEELEVKLPGWLYGREGRERKWLRQVSLREPAYFTPQRMLRPMSDLPEPTSMLVLLEEASKL